MHCLLTSCAKIATSMLKLPVIFFALLLGIGAFLLKDKLSFQQYGAPPYATDETDLIDTLSGYPGLENWKRPEGPIKVGLQAGHWKNAELPDELSRIRENGGGSRGLGVPEWQVVLSIAEKTKEILQQKGYVVDILPATVPEGYVADAFVSIHADGSESSATTGYKAAAPRRNFSELSDDLLRIVEEEYERGTQLTKDPNVTRNMRGYYGFSWWRYDHAVHPMTPSIMLETGFLTNRSDAQMLINSPEIPANALADGLISFFEENPVN